LKSSAEKLNSSLKICNIREIFKSPAGAPRSPRRFEFPRENLNFQRIVEGASGKLKSSAQKEKVPPENRNAQPKIQISAGKRSRRPENQNFKGIFGSLAENSKVQLEI
jgi:hypothetical protein